MKLHNISKFVQLNDFILLEYEFNRTGKQKRNFNDINPHIIRTSFGKVYFDNSQYGETNNMIGMFSLPNDLNKSEWLFVKDINTINRYQYLNSIISHDRIYDYEYPYDTIKIHIVSGYQFQDVDGFLLQLSADTPVKDEQTILSAFTWTKNNGMLFDKCIFFNKTPITVTNRTYDKYIKVEIPSIYHLGLDISSNEDSFKTLLNVRKQSDVNITFGTIPLGSIKYNDVSKFVLNENITTQFPPISLSDNFNCFISESSNGDYIEFYGMWGDSIIGENMNRIENGTIPLYTSGNPNDNYMEFDENWGDARVWALAHDIVLSEIFPNGQIAITQKMTIIQEDEFSIPKMFRPIIINSDVISSYNIQYTCRLINRMDGSQIIRKSSFSTTDTKKYGRRMTRINIDPLYNISVFNKISGETNINNSNPERVINNYIRTYVNLSEISINENDNKVYLMSGNSIIKLVLSGGTGDTKKLIDLTHGCEYFLKVNLSNGGIISVPATYSTNMNLLMGELEFEISEDVSSRILKDNKKFYIVGDYGQQQTTLTEGVFYEKNLKRL